MGAKFTASVFLLCYRMEKTLIAAMDGALSQTVPCEIIVSDDASDDRSFELAKAHAERYQGPHRLIVRRNDHNQGLCGHINTLAAMASGDIFVFMAGDDVSYPDRVKELLEAMRNHPDSYAVGSTVDEIDEHDRLLRRRVRGLKACMSQAQFLSSGRFVALLGASMAVRRELLIGLPPLQGMVEDNMLTLRATLFGSVYCLPVSLLQYRRHAGNLGSWIYSREAGKNGARRPRYERTIRMYREIADDHERCLSSLARLTPIRRGIAQQIISMYRLEAEAREALIMLPRSRWWGPIWRGIKHPGLRRKSFERFWKLFIPKRWLGI